MHNEHEHAHPHHSRKEFQLTLPIAIVVASFVIAGAILITRSGTPAATAQGSTVNLRAPSGQDHIVGSPNAPVVIVEYADFQCPFCAVIYPTLKKIVDNSGGKVAWVYRNFPLDSIHPEALPAANAAECIAAELGNAAFWQFADHIFTNQQAMNASYYAQVAQSLGADPSKFNACVTQKQYQSKIQADEAEAVQNGAQGTPYTVVIGKKGPAVPFSGALPESQVEAIVNSVLSKQ